MHETHKRALEEMLRNITEELSKIGIHDPKNPKDWVAVPEGLDAGEPDENLVADAVEDWDERNAIVAELETRYNAIVSALDRIENGTYGTCEVCGKPIEEERLTANPAARTCIEHREQ